jgi:methylmalonyl-CoA mutase N-terminal domain/subunit
MKSQECSKDVYFPADLEKFSYERDLGNPGEYPYTRGIHPTMYRGRLWTMRQYAGYGTAPETNRRFRYLLAQGQTGLSVAFDLPTQLGYDSDHPLAEGEVGRTGVAISTLDDLAQLFTEIPLDQVTTSMTINATAPILLAMYVVLAKRRGFDLKKLGGTVQNDILKEYLARGNYIYPIEPSLRLAIDIWEYCLKNLPKWHMVSISGYHIREAGATAVEELAFTLVNGLTYLEQALERGLGVDDCGPHLSFFFGSHNNFIEEIAKFRAARRIWARIMKERLGAKDPASCALRFHTQTCGSTLTARQPENNIVRVALQSLSAVLGGTQSLHTNSFDEALALPSEKAAQIALRTQQVIAFESEVVDIVDPLGGSYYLESLTNKIEAEVLNLIQEIEQQGGAVAGLEKGFMQQRIEESAYRYEQAVEAGTRKIVGVNLFQEQGIRPKGILKISSELQQRRKQVMTRFKKKRNLRAVTASRGNLSRAARGRENLVPHIIECLEAECTLGEISDTLREIFGSYDAARF